MPPVSGVDFDLQVKTNGSYVSLEGQRGGTFPRTMDEIDSTNKDSSGWHEGLPSTRNWQFEVEAVISDENSVQLGVLEDGWMNQSNVDVKFITPAAHEYQGLANVLEFNITGPHDDVYAVSIVLKGTGDVAKSTS